MIFRHAAAGFAILVFFTACSPAEPPRSAAVDPELERLAARAARVEIIRDDFGVPHVYGKTDADAVFGMLYAQAESAITYGQRAGWPKSTAKRRSTVMCARDCT
jgi:acyl-homoserine lactone acylase PvdQ